MTKMNNRVFGVIGVGNVMANWNADFSMNPRSKSDGVIFGSDKALKYAIKRVWAEQGETILGYKSLRASDIGELIPLSLDERFEALTSINLSEKLGKKAKSEADKKAQAETLNDARLALLNLLDVMNFGFTFAVKGFNSSIFGVVQVGQGLNKFEDTTIEVMDIISPFRNSNAKSVDALQTSIGKKVIADEAHYFYPFSVNPFNLQTFVDSVEGFEGYTREAYDKFKDASLVGATALNTNSKSGAFNHFGLFIELVDGSNRLLPPLDGKIKVEKAEDGRLIVDVSAIDQIVSGLGYEVSSAEIFVDEFAIELVGSTKFEVRNIYTRETI